MDISSLFMTLLVFVSSEKLKLEAKYSLENSSIQENGNYENDHMDNYLRLNNAGNECPEGWIFAGDICYYFNTEQSRMNLSWINAQAECENIGGYLAEPQIEGEQDFLKSMAKFIQETGQLSNWWIGLSDISNEGSWYWIHSEKPIVFSSWTQDRPNDETPNLNDCGIMYSGDQSYDWFDTKCDDSCLAAPISFICQKDNEGITTTTKRSSVTITTSTTTFTTTSTKSACNFLGQEWKKFEQNCYKAFNYDASWYEARDLCSKENANLASVHSAEEEEFIHSMTTWTENVYIGLYWINNWNGYEFRYQDGSDFDYSNWRYDEPNNAGCVVMIKDGEQKWADIDCSLERSFVCEKRNIL